MPRPFTHKDSGFTLVETLVGAFVLAIVAAGVYEGYASVLKLLTISKTKTTATYLANERMEIIRNMSYQNVGTVGGSPSGVILQEETVARGGITFTVNTTIRSIDDPFDGQIGGSPNDLSPADYKKVEISINCSSCRSFTPIIINSIQAPKNLETSSGNGALFIQVFDASGQPIPDVNVTVINTAVTPAINLSDVTNQDGLLQLVDVPPSILGYQISVSKSGYSSGATLPSGAPGNPNPTKPHATVAVSQVTQVSFAIDRVGSINWRTASPTCAPRGNIPFSLSGSKLIGANPNVPNYSQNLTTNSSGNLTVSGLEWDTYSFSPLSTTYDLAGSSPLLSMFLAPGASLDTVLVFEPKIPNSLLVSVKDGGTGLPVADATVTLSNNEGFTQTLITNRGFLRQTDWSGGGGQDDFVDPTKYESSDGNVETNDPAGDVTLRSVFGTYEPSGTLTSSTFDTGSSVTTYYNIFWQPGSQPEDTGSDSARFQVATNNDQSTWNFIGPDGTGASYYTLTDQNIHTSNNGHRYLRYRAYLQTASSTLTPNISDVAVVFGSTCTPYGQVFFQSLSSGTYTVSVSKDGYQSTSVDVNVSAGWQLSEITLSP